MINAEKKPQLNSLTGIRFFASIHVVLFHYLLGEPVEKISQNLSNFVGYGYSGVSLFFVLSGFILAYNYSNMETLNPRKLKRFWIARFARVYPLYLIALFLSSPSIFDRILHATSAYSSNELMASLLLSPFLFQAWTPWTACNWNCPGWSLSVEAFFYALFPFICIYLYKLSTRKLLFNFFLFWIISVIPPLVYLFLASSHEASDLWHDFIMYCPIFHISQFTIGVLTGILFTKSLENNFVCTSRINKILESKIDLSIVILLFIIILFCSNVKIPSILINNGLLAPLFATSIYILSVRKKGLSKFLALPCLTLLGEASYSIYILHVPINSLLRKIGEKIGYIQIVSSNFLFIRIFLLIGISILVFSLIEKPARRMIIRYI